jgi:DNA-binding IclR family transcriptional regulator
MLAGDLAGEGDVIQVVSRAFDVLRCFEGHEARLGNLEISNRCGLPRSTVSRLTHTLTRMGQLVYLPRDQKYRIGPSAVAMSTAMMKGLQLRNLIRLRLQDISEQLPGTVGFVIPDPARRTRSACTNRPAAVLPSGRLRPAMPMLRRWRLKLVTRCFRRWSGRCPKPPRRCARASRTTAAS